jgi:hypothetical protein
MKKKQICPTKEACEFRRVYDGLVCCVSPKKPRFEKETLMDGTLWETHCTILDDLKLEDLKEKEGVK